MLATIGTGQFIGECVEALVWVGVGIYVAWFRPCNIRREIAAGQITEEQGLARLKKFNPRLGYLIIIFGLIYIVSEIGKYA